MDIFRTQHLLKDFLYEVKMTLLACIYLFLKCKIISTKVKIISTKKTVRQGFIPPPYQSLIPPSLNNFHEISQQKPDY